VGELRRLREDYEGLLEDLEQYERLEGTVESLQRENDRLREQLGFAARTEEPALAAQIIARESATGFFSSFTINRGERHGVEPDQAVIAFVGGEEGLVGRVERVSGGTAVVVPVFAPGSYIGARLERSRHVGLLQGSGEAADALTMQYVPRDARNEIRYGDLVVTSGLNSIFPPEIPIGRVLRVSAPSWDTSLVIEVESVVDYSRLEYVFVLNAGSGQRRTQ
jgi:rod shape-determining protein MreC